MSLDPHVDQRGGVPLFADVTMEEFRRSFYRQRPLLVRGGARFLLERLYGFEDFSRWRLAMERHCPDNLRIDGSRMVAVLRASVVAPELAQVAARHNQFYGDVSCAFDAFSTGDEPGGSVGAHFDDNDNIILQQVGTKHWKLAPPHTVHPRTLHARAVEGVKIGHVIMPDAQTEIVLEPGDALYVPSFWVHWGIGAGSSLSLSLAMNPHDSARLLRDHPLFPHVERALRTSRRVRTAATAPDVSTGLTQLESLARTPAALAYPPTIVGRLELGHVLPAAARADLGRLLAHLSLLPTQPIATYAGRAFVRSLATLGELEPAACEAFVHTNLFDHFAERALEAIVFADTHQLEELAAVLDDWCGLIATHSTLPIAALLARARDAHALRELRCAAPSDEALHELDAHAPAVAALARRFVPVVAYADDRVLGERARTALAMRLGLGPQGLAPSLRVAHALGQRVGRAAARALSALSGSLTERMLPALAHDELACLGELCEVFGHLTSAFVAQRRGDDELVRASRQRARTHAERAILDARLTEPARALLERATASRVAAAPSLQLAR